MILKKSLFHALAAIAVFLTTPVVASAAVPSTAEDEAFVVRSNFFFQPGAWKTALEPEISYSSYAFTGTLAGSGSSGSGSISQTGFQGALTLERGLSSRISLGASANYGNQVQTSSGGGNNGGTSAQTFSGLGDPTIFVKGLYPVYDGSLIYGFKFDLSLGSFNEPNNNTSGNLSSGGNSYEPVLGYQGRISPGNIMGLLITYTDFADRTVAVSQTQSFTVTGGNLLSLTGFYELQTDNWFFDFGLSLGSKDETLTGGALYTTSTTVASLDVQVAWKIKSNLQGTFHFVGADYPNSIQSFPNGSGGSGTISLSQYSINPFVSTQFTLGARLFL